MLYVVDIGNSNIVLGVMRDERRMIFAGRVRTIKDHTTKQLVNSFRDAMAENRVSVSNVTGAIISSVVPELTEQAAEAVKEITGYAPIILKAGLEVGMRICTDHPKQVGADLIAAAVGAAQKYPGPLCIFDLGTATTLSVVTSDRRYLGTIIMPGVGISLNAMTKRASQLPRFSIEKPDNLIGRNTVDSMRSGVIYGNASMMDGLVDRVEKELGEKTTVVVTGGLGPIIQPFCNHKMYVERDLVQIGLWHIYKMNTENKAK